MAKSEKKTISVKSESSQGKPQKLHRGLGRGLGALIGESSKAVVPGVAELKAQAASEARVLDAKAVRDVPVEKISRSPWQPRSNFDEEALRELADSIKVHGIIQPLVCRTISPEKGGGYELITGERRLRASILAGLKTVPVFAIDAGDKDAAEMAIIENIQREDLNVIEEAEGYNQLIGTFGLTQADVADRVGRARSSVTNALRLLELPDEVKQLLSTGMLSVGHAKLLLSLTDEKEQILLARRVVTDGLSVRYLERLIAERKRQKEETRTTQADMPESHQRMLLDKLHQYFESPVRLHSSVTYANGKHGKGKIEIDYLDNDDLTRILQLFGIKVD